MKWLSSGRDNNLINLVGLLQCFIFRLYLICLELKLESVTTSKSTDPVNILRIWLLIACPKSLVIVCVIFQIVRFIRMLLSGIIQSLSRHLYIIWKGWRRWIFISNSSGLCRLSVGNNLLKRIIVHIMILLNNFHVRTTSSWNMNLTVMVTQEWGIYWEILVSV